MARSLLPDKEAILSGHFLLRHLNPVELGQLAGYARISRHVAQEVIFQRGDAGDSLMAVVRGRVKICNYSQDGKELVLNIIKPGELFGEIALIDGQPRTADAVAMETCDLLVLERRDFIPFIERHPSVAARLLTVLCQRLRRTSEHYESALFLEVPARLARALLSLAEAFGIPAREGICIDLKLSQQQLGGIVGITRESVNKHLNEWQRLGWIAMRSSYITLTERAPLERLAAGGAEEENPPPRPSPAPGSGRRPPPPPSP